MLGPVLVSVHNVRFYQRFMADIRQAIGARRFAEFLVSDPKVGIGHGEAETTTIIEEPL